MPAEQEVECVVAGADRLGEGPCWSAQDGRLYWFDIKSGRLNWYEPALGESGSQDLGVRASAAAACRGGGLIVATERGLAHWPPAGGDLRIVAPIDLPPGFRTNDGKIDPAGAFWWSTMDDDGGRRAGSLYRTRPGGATEVMLEGIHIPNTVSFSPDGERLYLADSRLQTIFAYDAREPAERTVFADTRGQPATPDGGAVDAEGFLWNAQWGGARIVRYAPDGRIDRIVPMPVSQPTSCAFGDADLATLYITSAWDDLSPAERAEQPLAGALFAFRPGVLGIPAPLFDLGALMDGDLP